MLFYYDAQTKGRMMTSDELIRLMKQYDAWAETATDVGCFIEAERIGSMARLIEICILGEGIDCGNC